MSTDSSTTMTPRQRYVRIAKFQRADRIPNYENKITPRQHGLWRKQGHLADLDYRNDAAYWEYFDLDPAPEKYRGVDYKPLPGLDHDSAMMYCLNDLAKDHSLLERWPTPREGMDYWLGFDTWGRIRFLVPKEDPTDEWANSAYHDIQGGVPSRKVWERIKDDFEPSRERLGTNWEACVRRWKTDDNVRILEIPAVGALRWCMGYENFCTKLYDDPELIPEILDRQSRLACDMMDMAMGEAHFDMVWFWEDLAYRNGPLFAPSHLERIASKAYGRMLEHHRSKGGDIVAVDSDGDCRALIPIWLKMGVNHIWPMEVFAGMDVVALREEYGQAFSMRGGVDKFCVRAGREAIDRELDRIFPIVQDGGYIPHLDHMMPTASFEDYLYYLERKKKMLAAV